MSGAGEYRGYDERLGVLPNQKGRLCRYAVDVLMERHKLHHNKNHVTVLLGPGSTAAAFWEQFARRLSDREITVVTNNLGVLPSPREHPSEWDHVRCVLYGNDVDMTNRSLQLPSDASHKRVIARNSPDFAVISCGNTWVYKDQLFLGAFTAEHQRTLRAIMEAKKLPVYVIVDDSKRVSPAMVTSVEHQARLKTLNPFASLPINDRNVSLIVDGAIGPELLEVTQEVPEAIKRWFRKSPSTCFLSYSVKHHAELAEQLHRDLTKEGIGCWKWDRNCTGGEHLWNEIEAALPKNLPVVFICAAQSLKRPAVQRELQLAAGGRPTAVSTPWIPLLLDDHLFKAFDSPHEFRHVAERLKATKGIDGAEWRKPDGYRSLYRLLADRIRAVKLDSA